jgi:hypothetical protein
MPNDKMPKWLASEVTRRRPDHVDRQHSIIEGALVTCEGPAKGHGVFLDAEFVDTVIEQGNATGASGLKARFGHPNMCNSAIGTFLGRWKNFRADTVTRADGTRAHAARADLMVSNSAAKAPQGDLKAYVLDLADNEADMFGTSIVFSPGKDYRRDKDGNKAYRHVRYREWGAEVWYTDAKTKARLSEEQEGELSEELYVECKELHADDVVDEPAANDGLFSAFSGDTVAGEVTEFLDLNPEIVQAFQDNPAILEALSAHHDQVNTFIQNYMAYQSETHGAGAAPNPQESHMSEETTPVPEQPAAPAPSESLETTPASEETPSEETPLETPAEPEQPAETPADESLETDPDEDPARAEFSRMVEDFGSDIAATVFAAGGTHADAQKAAYDASQARVADLEKQLAAKGGTGDDLGITPASAETEGKSFSDFFKSKKA